MSDKPRDWPNIAKEHRDQAAEEAVRAIKLMTPIVEGAHMSDTERLRREAIALHNLERIARLLEAVGAPTRAIN